MERLKEEILRKIDLDEVVELASDLIRIPSQNPPGDMRPIMEFVKGYFNRNAIPYEVHGLSKERPNLISRLKGSGPKRLILNGHLDVVPAGDIAKWGFDPFGGDIHNGYLRGRGASDMKAGLAGIMVAFKAAAKLSSLPGELILLLVSDEETGGAEGAEWILQELDVKADGCLIAEPSKENPTIGQKGSCWLKLSTRGAPEHGSLSPALNDNAICKMGKAIQALYRLWEREWPMPAEVHSLIEESKHYISAKRPVAGLERIIDHVTVNVGTIKGGDKVNKIPDYCEAEFDIRTPFGVDPKEVLRNIKEMLKEEGVEAEIEVMNSLIAANYTLPQEDIVRSVIRVAKKRTQKDVRPLFQWASSDARHFRALGIPTIQYGPAELEGIHSYNEKVSVAEIRESAFVYGEVIIDFLTMV